VLETMRLFKALGAELAENRPYMNLAVIAASVEMIDDVPVPFPVNVAGVEALIARIGDQSISLIAKAIESQTPQEVEADAGN
jgi:hypothetical protein